MIWGKTSEYNDGPDGIQRERRMSEWQRSMMLSPQQREMVQQRMIANPYDNESSTRLERINEQVNADPYRTKDQSSAYREAIAARLYNQPQSYSSNGQQDDGYARAQRSAQRSQAEDPSSQFTVGEINGRRVVAPQAGHYNAYNSVMTRLGLGDSPSLEAFSYAMEQQRIDPNKRYDSDARVKAAQGKNDMEREKMQSRERQSNMKTMGKQYGDANKAIDAVDGVKGYKGYLGSFKSALKDLGKDSAPEDIQAYMDQQGIPYSTAMVNGQPRFVPMPRHKWTPGLTASANATGNGDPSGDAMQAVAATPGGAYAAQQRMQQGLMSPEGQQVNSIYSRTGLGAPQAMQPMGASQPGNAMQAPQAPMGGSDEQQLGQVMNHLTGGGKMNPDQAKQFVLAKLANNPRKLALAQAYFRQQVDRYAAPQYGR
jgi:hypothetical protein